MAIDVEERRGKERKGRHIGKQCCIVRVAREAIADDERRTEFRKYRKQTEEEETQNSSRYIHTRTVATYLANIADVELSTISANFINT